MKQELNQSQQREILAILSVGCSRKAAARFAGCTAAAISRQAKGNPDFAAKLRRAEQNLEIESMRTVFNAAKQDKYWRASAWVLERKDPETFQKLKPDAIPAAYLNEIYDKIIEIILEEFPSAKQRKGFLKRLQSLKSGFPDSSEPADYEPADYTDST